MYMYIYIYTHKYVFFSPKIPFKKLKWCPTAGGVMDVWRATQIRKSTLHK